MSEELTRYHVIWADTYGTAHYNRVLVGGETTIDDIPQIIATARGLAVEDVYLDKISPADSKYRRQFKAL